MGFICWAILEKDTKESCEDVWDVGWHVVTSRVQAGKIINVPTIFRGSNTKHIIFHLNSNVHIVMAGTCCTHSPPTSLRNVDENNTSWMNHDSATPPLAGLSAQETTRSGHSPPTAIQRRNTPATMQRMVQTHNVWMDARSSRNSERASHGNPLHM